MKSVAYDPQKDVLLLRLKALPSKPSKQIGPFTFWWTPDGVVFGVGIERYVEETKEFHKRCQSVRLGGILRGISISSQDISKVRRELVKQLEKGW
ncbi:MAG: hypothetical protein AB1744_05325 [Candidatus Zixiibacteriota bacterium]